MRSLALAAGAAAALAAACGPLAPPPGSPTTSHGEVKLVSITPLVGAWAGTDEGGWRYALTIDAQGAFTAKIDRGDLGPCTQSGKVVVGAPEGWPTPPPPVVEGAATISFMFDQNACNEAFSGTPATAEVRGLDPLVIAVSDAVVTYAPAK